MSLKNATFCGELIASLPWPVQLVGKGRETREPLAGRDAGVHNNTGTVELPGEMVSLPGKQIKYFFCFFALIL